MHQKEIETVWDDDPPEIICSAKSKGEATTK